jgi:hypothetical protein
MAGRREQVVCREVDMGGGAGSPRLTGFWVDDLVAAEARDWPASFIEVITDW